MGLGHRFQQGGVIMSDKPVKHSLTPRMKKAFNFIKAYIEANDGTAPSMREIAQGMQCKSTSSSDRVVRALVDRGYITKLDGAARSINIKE